MEFQMTRIYNTTTGAVTDISIVEDGIHLERDILGNMDITGDGTGIFSVADDGPSNEDEAQADNAGCSYYGDDEAVTWWTDYVNGYNATQGEIDELPELLDDHDLADIAKLLDGSETDTQSDITRIVEWLRGEPNDHEMERAVFQENHEKLTNIVAFLKDATVGEAQYLLENDLIDFDTLASEPEDRHTGASDTGGGETVYLLYDNIIVAIYPQVEPTAWDKHMANAVQWRDIVSGVNGNTAIAA